MAKHSAPHGEEGTKSAQVRKGGAKPAGQHRAGTAKGTAAQQQRQQEAKNQKIAGHDDH